MRGRLFIAGPTQPDPMSVARALPLLAVTLLVAATAADAFAQPAFYFLKDAPGSVNDQVPPVPSPLPLPVAVPTIDPNAGVLDPYNPRAPNAPNGTTAKSREVPAQSETLLPIQFVTPQNHTHPDRIKGPLLIGLWTGAALTYQANLTATLYEVPAGGTPVALAEASVDLDFNQSNAPDPTGFIPPNSTHPAAIAYYELAQVYPMLLHPPAVFILGPLDIAFGNGSAFALGFRLTQGSSPAPLPAGASATLEYDGALAPSLVYLPRRRLRHHRVRRRLRALLRLRPLVRPGPPEADLLAPPDRVELAEPQRHRSADHRPGRRRRRRQALARARPPARRRGARRAGRDGAAQDALARNGAPPLARCRSLG